MAASSTSASTSSSTRPEPERAQAFEQARELADVADRGLVMPSDDGGGGHVFGQEDHVGAGGAAELNPIAVAQRRARTPARR